MEWKNRTEMQHTNFCFHFEFVTAIVKLQHYDEMIKDRERGFMFNWIIIYYFWYDAMQIYDFEGTNKVKKNKPKIACVWLDVLLTLNMKTASSFFFFSVSMAAGIF